MAQFSSKKEPGSFPVREIYGNEQRIAAIFNWFLGLMLASLLVGSIILLMNNNILEASITAVSTLPVLLGIYFARRKKFEAAATLLAMFMIFLMTLLATRGQGVHNITVLGLPAVLILASLVARKRIMVLLTFFSVACVAWLVFGDVLGIYTPNPFSHSVPGDFFSVSLILIATAVMVRLITESLFQSNWQLQKELQERKLAEQALVFSEKRFYQAFHSSPVMMTIEGEDHRFVDVNPAFCEALGYTRDEVLGRTASDLNLWDSSDDIAMVRKLAEEQKGLKNLELRFRRRSGEMGVILISSDRFEMNGIIYELTSGLDITERKQAERLIRESEERYRLISSVTSDYTFSTKIDGEGNMSLNWVAGAFEAMTGYTVDEYKAHGGWLAHLYPEDVEKDRQALAKLENNQSVTHEIRTITKAKEVQWVQVYAHPVWDEKTSRLVGIVGAVQDITERKQAEEKIRETANQLVVLNEIGRIISEVTDLNSVLEVIRQQLEKLLPFDFYSVRVFNETESTVTYLAVYESGKYWDESDTPLIPGTHAWRVFENGESLLHLLNEAEIERYRSNPYPQIGNRSQLTTSLIFVPLKKQGKTFGILSVQRNQPNSYTIEHLKLVEAVAIQVAIAIENARLFDSFQAQLTENETLLANLQTLRNSAAIVASTLNPPETAEQILEQIARVVPYDSASILLFDGDALEIVAGSGLPEGINWIGRRFSISDEPTSLPVLEGKIPYILYDDIQEVEPTFREPPYNHIHSWMSIPLKLKGQAIGILSLDSRQVGHFTRRHAELALTFADQVAVALENARLFEQLQEEKERAEVTLHSIGDAVITTDIHAQVDYINPVAENLTGWKLKEAIGQPLEKVFQVVNEESRKPVMDPVARCLQEGRVIGLANHSILIRRDGSEYSIDDSSAPIRNHKGEIIGAVLVFHDITKERRLSRQVAYDAAHDSLTGLVNRREFEKRLGRALNSAKERNLSHVLCYLDLDQFKIVNDTAGHAAGDELLKQVGKLLSNQFRQRDTLARLGGDEFGLLLENCQLDQALVICNDVLAKTHEFSFVWERKSFQVGVSIGVVPITAEKENATQLLSQADIACYSAKDLGRNRYYVYQSEDSETVQRHSEIVQASRMKDAIVHNQFLLYCQPIVELAGDHPGFNHYEVLLRMVNDEKNLVLPGTFIPSAERYGLMPAIDRWVIRQTFCAMSTYDIRGILVTINLSGNSLDDENLLEYVLAQLDEFSILPEQICFEITETAAIQHLSKAQKFIQAFRSRGGKIALDDFGSGFSSFRYLRTLTVDYLKIDGAFVSDMLSNPSDHAMVEAITQMAHTLGIHVIAEHASNLETINRLREMGVESAQGYGIGFPVPVEEAWKSLGPGGR